MLVRSDGVVRQCKSRYRMAAPAPIVTKHLLYEIEKVINARNGKWGREYFVKWRGYKSKDNSWIGELPSFFKKTSRFYIDSASDDESVVEHESDSHTDPDSDNDEMVDWDSDEDDAVETDEETEYTAPIPTRRKRKRGIKSAVKSDEDEDEDDDEDDDDDDDDESKCCKYTSHYARKVFLEEDSDDETNEVVGSSLDGPKTAVNGSVQLKASHTKTNPTKKEQLAMRALLALAAYVNDTESDRE